MQLMHNAHVPKLAKIVRLLGGFDPLAPSQTMMLSLDREEIAVVGMDTTPHPEPDLIPDMDDPGHTFKLLCIEQMRISDERLIVEVRLDATINGDVISERTWTFGVPLDDLETEHWLVWGTEVQILYGRTYLEYAHTDDETARRLAEEAAEWDKSVLIVDRCLAMAERQAVGTE
jgi:hypothetical protein